MVGVHGCSYFTKLCLLVHIFYFELDDDPTSTSLFLCTDIVHALLFIECIAFLDDRIETSALGQTTFRLSSFGHHD